jgi:hypothetical protein
LIVFIVLGEGNTDVTRDPAEARGALRVLVRRLLSEAFGRDVRDSEVEGDRLFRLRGRGGFARKLERSIAQHSRKTEVTGIAVAIDRDGPQNSRRLRLLEEGRAEAERKRRRLADRTAVGVMIEMLEAWLLADTRALARVLGATGAMPDPETIGDPKPRLNTLIHEAGLTIADAYDQLAESADLEEIRRRCGAFEDFAREVRQRAARLPS